MIHSYDEALLARACDSLGRMLDYSVHSLHQSMSSMMDLFCASGLAGLFERGDIRVIAGMSGIELAYETLGRSGLSYERVVPRHTRSLSAEYWCGHALARIQWESALPFEQIIGSFSVNGFISDYGKKRVEYLDSLPLDMNASDRSGSARAFGRDYASQASSAYLSSVSAASSDAGNAGGSALRKMRIKNGLSQSQLAEASCIPVRTIQQYEQGQKDICRARAEYLIALSRVLNCEPAALLEKLQG